MDRALSNQADKVMPQRLWTRRSAFKLAGLMILGAIGQPSAARAATTQLTADQALESLLAGNQRYLDKRLTHRHQDADRMDQLAQGQAPIAIILGCSDSRVSPEVIFDHGLGDLFVIRVAGNVVDDVVLGSIEYGADALGVPLVIVLGHERCGAVSAAVDHAATLGHVSTLVRAIQPAMDRVGDVPIGQGRPAMINAVVLANVQQSVDQIKTSQPVMANLVRQGQVKVVGARYDLDDGRVEIVA
jgi:carbonic anhydrase